MHAHCRNDKIRIGFGECVGIQVTKQFTYAFVTLFRNKKHQK
jgi:hypothetical protein